MADEPRVGATYHDARGRYLTVDEVEPKNPLGREVRGALHEGDPQTDSPRRAFSTTLPIFAATWAPPGVKPPVMGTANRGKW